MFWVLQDNLYAEKAFEDLLIALERLETPYQIIKVIPFIHTFEPDINPVGDVFVCGATSLRENAKTRNWSPGYFDENLDYRLYIENYGNHMLNYHSIIKPMRDIERVWDQFFVRPILDSKSFSGQIMTWDEFSEWRIKVEKIKEYDCASTLTTDDIIVMAPISRKIYAEYRFFVINGKVVTGSQYKLGSRVVASRNIPTTVSWFAQNIADLWCPNKAFCLDVCEVESDDEDRQLKVMEINAINSAGFYDCDMYAFVNAINNMNKELSRVK